MIAHHDGSPLYVSNPEPALGEAVSVLLSTPQQAREMGRNAQQVVVKEKGATERHAWVLLT